MHATKVAREPARRSRVFLLGATAAAVLLIALIVLLVQSRDDAPATAQAPVVAETPENTLNTGAAEVATSFLQAYGAFDVKRAMTYLAGEATIASMGVDDDPRLLNSWLEATGYRQMLGSCEQLGNPSSGSVRCPFEFHALRSGEIGRGPFGGASFDLVIREGRIVHVAQNWEIEEFSPQMWEPFAKWVSKAHPTDIAVMYLDENLTAVRLSEESIRLWERNTQRYVDEVKRNRRSVSRASSTRSG